MVALVAFNTMTCRQSGRGVIRLPGLILLLLSSVCTNTVDASNNNAKLRIKNDSSTVITLDWIHPDTGDGVKMSDISPHTGFNLDTFVGHKFKLIEQPMQGQCVNTECKIITYVVDKNADMSFVITEGIEFVPQTNRDPAAAAAMKTDFAASEKDPRKVVEQCRQRALEELTMIPHSPDDIISRMKECVEIGVSASLLRVNDEIEFHSALRTQISTQMENHTCTDETLDTTPDVVTRDWISEKDGQSRTVHVKLDRPASRIHVIENFASVDECTAMEETAAPKLHAASVADGKGGIQYSQNRKAKQAGITPKWQEEENGDLVARLSRRVYEYTNHELGLNLSEKGQEPLMSIQYFGRGYNDTEPDRYTPHCDGVCNGEPHRYGTRMATMVIYCTIPERGGHTNFQNAGVHIKPVELSAIFFSYIDPETNLTDKGLTTHSGCPVFEGEKKIITQWVRYGVTADVPWGAYNTLGILKTEAGG